LREKFGSRLFGPVVPPVDKVRGQYIMRLLLKIESGRSMARARELIREVLARFAAEAEYKSVNVSIDVDVQ
jgi:primosomal protein N' (replication factor Y)